MRSQPISCLEQAKKLARQRDFLQMIETGRACTPSITVMYHLIFSVAYEQHS